MKIYTLKSLNAPSLSFEWDMFPWVELPVLNVDSFRPEGSDHRPLTQARFCYWEDRLYGLFSVHDRYVRSVHTAFQSHTHRDSCVEVFLQPRSDLGYFSFEFNAGGVYAALYITDPTRVADSFKAYQHLTEEDVKQVRVVSSLPAVIESEITEPVDWTLGFEIPLITFEAYLGKMPALAGQSWRANVYKCGDETSHPHWASWAPVPELNFHLPESFGEFRFAMH